MSARILAALVLLSPALAAAQTAAPAAPEPAANGAPASPDPTQPETHPDPVKPQPPPVEATPLLMKSLKLKLSGVIYGSWGIDVASAADGEDGRVAGNNRFDLTRAYINVEPQITDKVALRITPDITRVSGTDGNLDGSLAFRLKYAYAQFNDVAPGLAVKAGLQHTAYIDFEDSLWKYRVLGPSAYEFFTKKSSSDLGVGAIGKHLDGALEYQVVLANGEGYAKAERAAAYPEGDGKYKEAGARVTVAPFAGGADALRGLKVTGFAQYGFSDGVVVAGESDHLTTSRVLGLASYEHPLFTVATGYGVTGEQALAEDGASIESTSGGLFTAFGFVNLPAHLRVLGRFDSFDPDTDAEDDGLSRVIGGVAYVANDLVQVIADWQHFGYQAKDVDPTVVGDQIYLHLEAKY